MIGSGGFTIAPERHASAAMGLPFQVWIASSTTVSTSRFVALLPGEATIGIARESSWKEDFSRTIGPP